MKEKKYLGTHVSLLAVLIIMFASCCNNDKQSSGSKEAPIDSLKIVKAYLKKHPQPMVVSFDSVHSVASKDMEPIDWEKDVTRYAGNYDEYPAMIKANDTPMRGWRIYENDLDLIRKKVNYRQLYLRLGRRGDGSYTLMILPLKGDGSVLYRRGKNPKRRPMTDPPDNNYDHLDPCPDQCPSDFDTPPPPIRR
jgi:hypothetical protein